MPKKITIIGAGIIGLCAALYCRRRGMDVTLIERNPRQRDGCSFGNAGMIVPSHFVPLAAPGMVRLGLKWMWNPRSPFYIKPRLSWDLLRWGAAFWKACTWEHVERAAPLLRDLHLASRACYEELAAESDNAFGFSPTGMLLLCQTPHALEEEAKAVEQARRLGMPTEVLDARGVSEQEPNLRADVLGATFYPMDGHLQPEKLMAWLESRVLEAGCTIYWNTPVTGFDRDDGKIRRVLTATDGFEADEFIVAGGMGSSTLARHLGLHLPLQAGKGYSLTLTRPHHSPRSCAILVEARVAVTPSATTLRFGGTMELAGIDHSINRPRVEGIIDAATRYYPDFTTADFDGIIPWHGLRPCSPDGLPYLGRTRAYSNLIVATGHAMMGVSLGPITGKIVSELAAGEAPTQDLKMLSPDRYQGSRPGAR
jgi:D-amino-acid dehydrogenase